MNFSIVNLRPTLSGLATLSLLVGAAVLSACVHPADPCHGESYDAPWDEESLLGITPGELIAPFEEGHQVVADSPTREGAQEISLSLTRADEEIWVYDEAVEDHPNCSDELRLPVQVHLATADGALDEHFEDELIVRLDRDRREIRQIRRWLPVEEIQGDWTSRVSPDPWLRALQITIDFDGEHTSGEIREVREEDEGRSFTVIWSW